ncbi:PfkB family carbohydrate kinase [Geoglobus acetivorans]|uniref:Carbohydrate kinase family protein n=1 Tax=Geoglobus acetivorans TaxID=565033 RepID=A0ABZ3H4F6_GEOAI|nr:carbohydrate kinase family protein [Geoglobus acetivorans]
MIAGFGALNLDKIYLVDKIPSKDEEGFVIDVDLHPGGSAANTIAGLATFGVRTSFIGKVGSDEEGRILIGDFENRRVDTSGIIRAEGRSGVAMIFVDREGERAILVDPGVNDTIREDEINWDVVEKSEIIHMTSFICRMGDDSFRSQIRVAKRAERVSLDPGMPYAEKGLKGLERLLKETTVFLPNRKELEIVFGMDWRDAVGETHSLGVEIVAVKLGKEGCFVSDGGTEEFVKAFPSNPVDTTGAGDAFNAGFLYGLQRNKDIVESAKIGNYVASKLIERVGARSYGGIDPESAVR